jgi:hypothetical protein
MAFSNLQKAQQHWHCRLLIMFKLLWQLMHKTHLPQTAGDLPMLLLAVIRIMAIIHTAHRFILPPAQYPICLARLLPLDLALLTRLDQIFLQTHLLLPLVEMPMILMMGNTFLYPAKSQMRERLFLRS